MGKISFHSNSRKSLFHVNFLELESHFLEHILKMKTDSYPLNYNFDPSLTEHVRAFHRTYFHVKQYFCGYGFKFNIFFKNGTCQLKNTAHKIMQCFMSPCISRSKYSSEFEFELFGIRPHETGLRWPMSIKIFFNFSLIFVR